MEQAGPFQVFPFFRNDREAVFLRRPNRFLIIAGDEEGREIPCHCPNPGRLLEFLFPGERLILEKRAEETRAGARAKEVKKTEYTAAAIYHQGRVAPLYAARANQAAQALILPAIIPGLQEVRPEFTLGDSRFDFLCLDRRQRRHLVEVKACSLVEYETAMFPDAPSLRALKHLEELCALASGGLYRCHVLFVIVHGKPRRFIPNLHTDPAFAAALSRCARNVAVHAALLECGPQGEAVMTASRVPVDLSWGKLAAANRGSYLVVLELPEGRDIAVGGLGTRSFEPGWYVYAGSAQKNLAQRTARHLRRARKTPHWHLDYLTPYAGEIQALPVMTWDNLECAFAAELAALGGRAVPGFGCSDCRCGSHLYFFADPPLHNREFVGMLLRYRSGGWAPPSPRSDSFASIPRLSSNAS